MEYKIDNFRDLIAYKKALELYKEINDIRGLGVRDSSYIRKHAGKIASNIARAKGSGYYPDQQIYYFKEVIKYANELEKELDRLKVKDSTRYIEDIIEIKKLVYSYMKKLN